MIGISILAFLLCSINVIGWLIFLTKFRKLFTTDDIIKNTRMQVTSMIEDVNRYTARDIDIIEQKLKIMKAAVAEADRHISVARQELDKQVKISQYQNTIDQRIPSSQAHSFNPEESYYSTTQKFNSNLNSYGNQNSHVSQYSNSQVNQNFNNTYQRNFGDINDGLTSQNAYSITKEGSKFVDGEQGDLFNQPTETTYINSPSGTRFSVDNDGVGIASIPTIAPNITFADEQIKPKKSINLQIKELAEKGMSVDFISSKLGLTTTEVQFAIEMGLK